MYGARITFYALDLMFSLGPSLLLNSLMLDEISISAYNGVKLFKEGLAKISPSFVKPQVQLTTLVFDTDLKSHERHWQRQLCEKADEENSLDKRQWTAVVNLSFRSSPFTSRNLLKETKYRHENKENLPLKSEEKSKIQI